MRKSSLLYASLGLTALLWVLNFIALYFYLYWTLWWYDFMMHFLGGITLGVFIIWALGIKDGSLKSFLKAFALVLALSVVWEIAEYITGTAVSTEGYVLDTTNDFVMDILGMIAAFYYATLRPRLSSPES